MVTMMFWYGGGWAWWQAGLMWIAMIAFWVFLIWAIYALVTGVMRRGGEPGHGGQQPETRAASWMSGWPAARSTPRSTGGCAR
jgi:hypothetical protein